jgi:hypothetical protein
MLGATPQGCRVYCYHGIVREKQDNRLERNFHLLSDFREHVRFFRRHRVMTLAEVSYTLSLNSGSKCRTAVISFDDGYANNLLAAASLAEAKLPWTIFVSAGAAGGILGGAGGFFGHRAARLCSRRLPRSPAGIGVSRHLVP